MGKTTTEARPLQRRVSFWRYLFGSIAAFTLLMIWTMFFTGEVRALEVISGSMEPTLAKGDRVLVHKLADQPIERGSIVIFNSPDDEGPELVKRVVGIPGDVIELRNGLIYVNGELSVPPGMKRFEVFWDPNFKLTLGRDEYYVLGDNRMYSHDSTEFGAIHRRSINGHVIYRYSPGSRFGAVK